MRSPSQIPPSLLIPPLLLALPSLLAPLLLLPRGTAARVFTLGYITGSRRRPGDFEYSRPGLTISGAASLAVAEVNGEPTPPYDDDLGIPDRQTDPSPHNENRSGDLSTTGTPPSSTLPIISTNPFHQSVPPDHSDIHNEGDPRPNRTRRRTLKQDGGTSDGSPPDGEDGKYGALVAGRVFGGDPGKTLRSMGHRLELRVAETYGEEAESIRAAARLWRDGVDAYLGPQETCVHEGRMAAAFNLPMVSYFCTHRETSDKKRYPTFARTRPPDTQICKSVVSLLLHFNWTQVAFLHQTSIDSEFSAVASTLLAALDASGIGVRSVRTWSGPFHLGYMDNPFLKILEDTKENARVYVVLGHYHEHIGLLVAMDEMELLDSGDYFVVGVDSSDPYDSSAPTKYFAGPLLDRPHPRAISASRSYLAVLPSPSPVLISSATQLRPRTRPLALPRPSAPGIRRFFPAARVGGVRKNGSSPDSVVTMTSAQQAADRFSALVNLYMELPPFSFKNPLVSLGVAVKIPPEAAYLYDAIHLYTRALESVLLSGGDPRNGTAIIEAMRGARYFSAMGYIVSLDSNGDAGGNYTVIGRKLVPSADGGQMEYAMVSVGRFYAPAPPATKGAGGAGATMGTMNEGLTKDSLPELRMLQDVDWVNGEPPLAEPSCGFAGEKCITYTAEIVASVAGGVALTLAVIGLVLYRNWRYEQALDSLLWKVDFRDIQMYEPGEQTAGPAPGTTNGSVVNQTNNTNRITRPLIRTSQASLSSNPDAEWRRGVAYTPVGIYRGRPFAIKKLQSFRQRPLAVDRAMKKELKMMRDLRHDNLVCFIGACTEPPNVCIVTEYCARGSLRDILENEDLKLDNMFVASLIGDILRGMIFLHDSPIRSHGSLRPSNCLVDSRWVLKIADFGLHSFKREADARPLKHVHDYMAMSQDYHSSTGEPGSKIGGSGSRRRKRCDSSSQQHSESSASKEAMDEARNYIESVLYRSPELLRAAVSSYYVTTPSSEEGISWGQALAKALPSDPVPLASAMAAAWDSRPDLWPGTQRGDAYAFGLVVYELHARQGPFGTNAMPGITQSDILKRVMAGSPDDSPFRPPLDSLETSFDFVRDCLKECWAECADDRPDFRSIRLKLRPIRKGMKPNIFDNMMAMMEKYANNLEQLVDERTDQLIVEKRKTDALLYEMLPRCVAEQLKRGHRVEAESYDCVTIYFSDIVGFTAMSAESTPLQVVDFLNDLYTCFDSILENYDVYKVETIGDAYMVVSGLPIRNGEQHAAEIASMSLHLLSAVTKFRIRHRPNDPLQLRIGIHSGPVCAGVVGLKMPRYCLFGDTVNTTSRMESNGIPLKIHCSTECRSILDRLGGYRLVSRGLVNMKGKGEVLTHWLLGEDSEGEDGIPDVARNTPKGPEAVGVTSKDEGVDIADGSTDPPKQDDTDLLSDGRESTSASQGTLSPGGQANPNGNTDPGVTCKNDVLPKENSSAPDVNRIRSHRSLTPPLRGDNPISAPVRSSMRKHHPGTGEWHGGEGNSYTAHGLPGHSSLRKHHALAGVGGGGGMRRGGFRGRRRSLESSPKKLRFASEVVGEGAGIERPIGDGNTSKQSDETGDIGKSSEGVSGGAAVGGAGTTVKEKQGEGATEGDKQRRMSKMKRRRRKAADGNKGSSTGEWKLLLSNTVPPWRRRGKSAECLEREDPWAWDLTMGRIGVGGLPAFYNQTAYQKLGVPRGGFPYPVNDRGIPKARSIASMGGASATSGHLDAHAIRDSVHMDRSPVDFFRAGSGKLAVSPADRLNVPMIQSGMYSSTSCESNQSQEWSDCGAANSAEELDDGGRRADGSTEWKAFGEGEEGHTTHFNGSPVGVIAGEEEGLLEEEWNPIRGMEEGRGAEFDGGYRAGGRTLDRIDGYAEDGSEGDEELDRPLLPSVGGGNARI